jgi:hypothetical protein
LKYLRHIRGCQFCNPSSPSQVLSINPLKRRYGSDLGVDSYVAESRVIGHKARYPGAEGERRPLSPLRHVPPLSTAVREMLVCAQSKYSPAHLSARGLK